MADAGDAARNAGRQAGVYDLVNGWTAADAFYLDLVMSARSVLDVGCGTGVLLHRARQAGHTGRLCGLDPSVAMLERARAHPDVEWVLGDIESASWQREFDLVVMTGHAFQVLVEDDALRAGLASVRAALTADGRFVFETRNPLVRAWERWMPQYASEVVDEAGQVVRTEHEVRGPVVGGRVTFTETHSSPGWDRPVVSRTTLRFLGVAELASFLTGAGLRVEEQYGDWSRGPLTDAAAEIITVARPGGPQRPAQA